MFHVVVCIRPSCCPGYDYKYLVSYDEKHDDSIVYRMDKMSEVEILDDPVDPKAVIQTDAVSTFTEQAFKMYGGEVQSVTLQFENKLIDDIFDKFGEDTAINRISDSHCHVTVDVQISPTFWGWTFTFAREMKIIAPDSLIQQYSKLLDEVKAGL